MDDQEREQIVALATDWHMKAEMIRMLQQINVPADGEARLKLAINYELACVEERRARWKLDRAKEACISVAET